jgi:hypothetical protein
LHSDEYNTLKKMINDHKMSGSPDWCTLHNYYVKNSEKLSRFGLFKDDQKELDDEINYNLWHQNRRPNC